MLCMFLGLFVDAKRSSVAITGMQCCKFQCSQTCASYRLLGLMTDSSQSKAIKLHQSCQLTTHTHINETHLVLADLSLLFFFCRKIQVLVGFNSPRLPGIVVPGLCGVAVVSRTHGSVPAEAILIFFFRLLFFYFLFPNLLGRGLVF